MCGKDGRGHVCWNCYVNLKNNTFYGLCQGLKQFPTDDPLMCNLCNTCRIGCKVPNYTHMDEKKYMWCEHVYACAEECISFTPLHVYHLKYHKSNNTLPAFQSNSHKYWQVSNLTSILWNVFSTLTNNQPCLQTQYIQNNKVPHI